MHILLTRPLARAPALAQRFLKAGHRVSHAPVTQIAALDTPHPSGAFDGLIVTSASAVIAAAPLLDNTMPCLATGPATAKALREAGFKQVEHFSGEIDRLLDHLKRQVSSGARAWLYPCGRKLSHTPEALMARSGATIAAWPIYDAQDAGPWPEETIEMLRAGGIDWTLFLSTRTAQLFARNCQIAQLWPQGAPGRAACISRNVAQAVEGLGYKESCVGEEKTTSSLVAAMGLTYC